MHVQTRLLLNVERTFLPGMRQANTVGYNALTPHPPPTIHSTHTRYYNEMQNLSYTPGKNILCTCGHL